MAKLDLNRDQWKQFKLDNNLSKSSFFKKADVGPTIEKFQDAIAAYKKANTQKNLMSAFKKGEDLQKAFDKFVKIKEAKDELSTAALRQIGQWSTDLDAVIKELALIYKDHAPELQANDAKDMNQRLDKMFNF